MPSGTAELVLFVLGIQPANEKLFFNWAIAGLDPSLGGLQSGLLPKGAISGRNGFGDDGYSICPAEGTAETYIFALYALPRRLSSHPGFDPQELREEVLQVSPNAGLMAVSYGRG